MSEKHYPCIGGGFNRIIFDGDNSVWVPEYENAKLKAENEKLKMERDRWHFEARQAQYDWGEAFKQSYRRKDEIADLKEENEKLRLLVRGLDYCTEEMNYSDCEKCPLGDDDESLRPTCERMMEELGIKREEI